MMIDPTRTFAARISGESIADRDIQRLDSGGSAQSKGQRGVAHFFIAVG
jgi:hypothetical protein